MTGDIYDLFPAIVAAAQNPVVILEIGVGRAEDTGRMVNWLIHHRRPYHYYAFEPEAKNIPAITEKVGSKVVLVSAAIGDLDGDTDFISSGSWPLSGSVKQPKNHLKSYPWIPWQAPVKVPMVRLDTFAAQHGIEKVDFIWADTQGGEDLLIAGGLETLKRTHYFYTEFYSTEEYAGQIDLLEIHARLPGKWEIVEQWVGDIPGSGNVLFKNLSWAT